MALDGGNVSFTASPGTKSINLGVTGSTWIKLRVQAPGYQPYYGFVYGGPSYQYNYSDSTSALDTTKAVKIRNSAGTIVIEGTFTSFTTTYANFNITTNVASPPVMMIEFGN